MRKYLVIGLGNPLFGVDAMGPLLAEALAKCGVNAVSAWLDAFTAVSYLEEVQVVVFIDVFDKSFGELGEVVKVRLDPKRLSRDDIVELSREISAHSVTPAHIVVLGHASGVFHGEAWLVGPVVERLEFEEELGEKTLEVLKSYLEELLRVVEEITGVKIDKECVKRELSTLPHQLA